MNGAFRSGFGVLSLLVIACGGSTPPAEEPGPMVEPAAEVAPSEPPKPAADATTEEPKEDPESKPKSEPMPDPQFAENSSVEDAIKAVPPGADRLNIDNETLGKPLQEAAVYEPCKPGNAKFKLRVAVWNGKAVGIDVETTPKNPKLAECIKGQIKELTWKPAVRSLNTVEYSF